MGHINPLIKEMEGLAGKAGLTCGGGMVLAGVQAHAVMHGGSVKQGIVQAPVRHGNGQVLIPTWKQEFMPMLMSGRLLRHCHER